MIKRYSEDYLRQWYSKKNRKPLVIRGARQVGKSTLVREFSKNSGHSLLEINLEKHLNMEDVFKRLNAAEILNEISLITGKPLNAKSGDILFLDEIQATPNEGKMAEQFIAQHLRFEKEMYIRPQLHYWLREKRKSNAEIDFLIQSGRFPIPVEVKAGKSGGLKSLHLFCEMYNLHNAVRFDLNKPSALNCNHKISTGDKTANVTYKLVNLPLYMVEEVRRIAAAAL